MNGINTIQYTFKFYFSASKHFYLISIQSQALFKDAIVERVTNRKIAQTLVSLTVELYSYSGAVML